MRGIAGALLALAVFPAGAGQAAAQTSPELAEMYARGDYLPAASMAEEHASADDLAFAARALLAMCVTSQRDPDPAIVDRASKNAEAALRIDPDHEEGRLQLAIALSLKSRAMDVVDAWNAGYGEKGRKLAQDVLKADPANFYAHGFLAVWNLEVRRRGGSIGGALMGASVREGRRHYEEAARLAPDDVGIHWTWARALVALNTREYASEAQEALSRAQSASAGDRVEQVMQERAQRLSEMLRSDRKVAQTLARQTL